MRVLVFGSSGQLGSDVAAALRRGGETCISVTRADADLTDVDALRDLVSSARPDAIVNCAAFHDVAGCEAQPDVARAVNATAVAVLASAARDSDARFMTVSTDYVFDGTKSGGYTEADSPNPLNIYGETKLEGERAALTEHTQTFVVRTQSLYGLTRPTGKGPNFVELVLGLAEEREELKVDQFRMAPTSTASLAENMRELLLTDAFGLYHMSSRGETTWYEFARKILEQVGSRTTVTAVPNDYYKTNFVRPENTYLINAELQAIGLDRMPHWETALDDYLTERAASTIASVRGRP